MAKGSLREPNLAKLRKVRVPLGDDIVASRDGLNLVPVVPAEQDLEHPVPTPLLVAVEHGIGVDHDVAPHHLRRRHHLGSSQDGEVLESDLGTVEESGGQERQAAMACLRGAEEAMHEIGE